MIVAVGSGADLSHLIPEITGLLERPLVTLERVRVCKRDGLRLADPQQIRQSDESGLATWVKLMVHADQDARHAGRPLYVEIIRRLREAKASGATVLHGIWGYHSERPAQGDKLLSLRRHVPTTTTIIVDAAVRIHRWFEIIDELTDEAWIVTSELVPAFRAGGEWGEAGGLRLADKQEPI